LNGNMTRRSSGERPARSFPDGIPRHPLSDARGDLSDEEWLRIEPLLPSRWDRKERPSHDNRLVLNGMLHVLRTGCPWRDMHERYGKWNSIYVRFRRWNEQGLWDALLERLVELGLTDDWQHVAGSTGSQPATARGGLARTLLIERAAILRQKFISE
jgi:transposase